MAITKVKTGIVIFSDANTKLNTLVIKNIVRHFYDENVGAVAGEKRVEIENFVASYNAAKTEVLN